MRNFIKILLVLFFCTIVRLSFSQIYYSQEEINIDSLENIATDSTGVERIGSLDKLSYYYRISDKQKCLNFAREAYELAKKMDDPSLIAETAFYLGTAYHHLGNYPVAIRYALESWEEGQKTNNPEILLQRVELIVMIYLYSGNYDLATEYAEAVYKKLELSKFSTSALFDVYIRMGWVYLSAEMYQKAIPYFQKAQEYNSDTINILHDNIALNASHLSNCYLSLGKYDSALFYAEFANGLRNKYKLRALDAIILDIGDAWLGLEELDSATVYYKHALKIFNQNEAVYFKALAHLRLGSIAEQRRNFDDAIFNYSEAIKFGNWVIDNKSFYKKIQDEKNLWYTITQIVPNYFESKGLKIVMKAHQRLSKTDSASGQFKNAYAHLEEYMVVQQKIFFLENKKEVLELNTKYESERNEQRALLLEKENDLTQNRLANTKWLLYGTILFFVMLLLITLLYIRQNRLKAIHEKTNLQNKLFRLQLNPHFLYNSLAGIQKYIVTEDPDNASIYLSKFSNVIRKILESSVEEFIPLEDEINACENYLALQQLRFAEKLDYSIEVDNKLDIENIQVPPMLIQPFIENAIDHGIKHLPGKGKVIVTYKKNVEAIIIEVLDNGVGRMEANRILKKKNPNHKSLATKITRERINVYNKELTGRISFTITDLVNEDNRALGTLVKFSIPFF